MFSIYMDDKLLYAQNIPEYRVLSPKLTIELNKAGSLSFTMPSVHPAFDDVKKLKGVIQVKQNDIELWRGRSINDKKGFYNKKQVYCEGELAFFNDSIVRPYSFQGGVKEYFEMLIKQHNEQVDDFKRFKVGKVTVIDSNDYIVRANVNYPKTLSEINEKLVKNLGGYLITRCENGINTIDYVADPGKNNTQIIQFGINLLDLEEYINAEDVFTVLVPLGKKLDGEDGKRLTIENINNGKDYIENNAAIKLFGHIVKVETWDDVTLPENLLKKGIETLNTGIEMAVSLSIKAIDLALIDVDAECIKLGDYIRVISLPHGLDAYFLCSKIVYDLQNPDKTTYTLGVSFTSMTDKNIESKKNSNTTYQIATAASSAASRAETAIVEIKGDYVKRSEFNQYQQTSESVYAKVSDIPKKLSELENDSGYIKEHQSLAGYARVSDIPKKISELENDKEYIDKKVFDELEKRVELLEKGGE